MYNICPHNSQSVCYVQNSRYSETYNPSWNNHPNFSWGGNQQQHTDQGHVPQKTHRGNSPSFQQNTQSQQHQSQHRYQQAPSSSSSSSLQSLLKEYITKNDALLRSRATSIRNLEIHMGQIVGELKNRPQGSLPSTNEASRNNRKQQCQAVMLRSVKPLSIRTSDPGSLKDPPTSISTSTFQPTTLQPSFTLIPVILENRNTDSSNLGNSACVQRKEPNQRNRPGCASSFSPSIKEEKR